MIGSGDADATIGGARSASSSADHHHRRRLASSPIQYCRRRVIFPILHPPPPAERFKDPAVGKEFKDPAKEGADDDGNASSSAAGVGGPVLHRASSLDGIVIPLPRLSHGGSSGGNGGRGVGNANEEFVGGTTAGGGQWAVVPAHHPRPRPSPAPASSSSSSGAPTWESVRSSIASSSSVGVGGGGGGVVVVVSGDNPPQSAVVFGEGMRHRPYYYPVASPPPRTVGMSSPTTPRSGPPPSILRAGGRGGGAPLFSPATTPASSPPPRRARASSCSSESSTTTTTTTTQPTLASPASIVALHMRDGSTDHGGGGSIGGSVHDLERLTEDPPPRVVPSRRTTPGRSQERTTLRKSRSTSIVLETTTANDGESGGGWAGAAAGHHHRRRDSVESATCSSPPSRHDSLEFLGGNRRVCFDPHITVHEFGVMCFERRGGGKWWNEYELEEFKREAIQRIRSRSAIIVPTGTGRALAVPTRDAGGGRVRPVVAGGGGISFNHPALGCEDEYDPRDACARASSRDGTILGHLSQEIRNILVVDPHEVFLTLFRKSLKHIIPHAAVATAQSAEEALVRIEAARRAFPVKDGGSIHGFDVIIVEENLSGGPPGGGHARRQENDASTQSAGDDSVQRRWNMTSGSCLCCHLAESQRLYGGDAGTGGGGGEVRLTLIIGVSARLDEHRVRLEKAGADCVWGKPPPEMNATLRNNLLRTLMKKRGSRIDFRLFDAG